MAASSAASATRGQRRRARAGRCGLRGLRSGGERGHGRGHDADGRGREPVPARWRACASAVSGGRVGASRGARATCGRSRWRCARRASTLPRSRVGAPRDALPHAGGSAARSAVGSRTANSVRPGRLCTVTLPPCAATTASTIAGPARCCRCRRDRDADPAGEPLEHVRQQLRGDPRAVVGDGQRARRRRRGRGRRSRSCPAGVCVRALASRLVSTWVSRGASPGTTTGSSGRSSCQRWSSPAAWRR